MKKGIKLGLILLVFFAAARTEAGELLWSQRGDNFSIIGPSTEDRMSAWPVNAEVADDFDIDGIIDRVVVFGWRDFVYPQNPTVLGTYVRFYEWTASGPGALQFEYFAQTGAGTLVYDPVNPMELDVTLTTQFRATGRHFISAQLAVGSFGPWYWTSSNTGSPKGSTVFYRNNLAVANWSSAGNSDGSFLLYGMPLGAPHIDGLSETTAAKSGRLVITGMNFSNTQGSGRVMIGGISAWVTTWTSSAITAYVPEGSHTGDVPVQVVTSTGASNTASLAVTDRQPNGRVKWRFRMEGYYAIPRPAVAADGTVYAVDLFGYLYALSPDGGLKWIVRGAGNKGVDVGADGTVYAGSEDRITAVNPNGTIKWTFMQNPRAFILHGPNVGPDGNIYGVASEGLGIFSLTPQGKLRWRIPERYDRPPSDYMEVKFGPNRGSYQLYFRANRHFMGIDLNGTVRFNIPTVGNVQLAVGPDGSIYTGRERFSPDGKVLNTASYPFPSNTLSAPDAGSDGTVCVIRNASALHVFNNNLTERWSGIVGSLFGAPVIDPLNRMVVMYGADAFGMSGYIQATSITDGSLYWRVSLLDETNHIGMSRARFAPDSDTVYITTSVNQANPYSFVYAIETAGTPSGAKLSSLTLAPENVTGGVTSQGTLTLSGPAPVGGAVVTLTSDYPSVVAVPQNVSIPAGAYIATFNVATAPVAMSTKTSIHATYSGVTKSAFITVVPEPAALSALALNPLIVTGGGASQGTVTLSGPAPVGGAVVSLASSSASVSVPANVTVAAGATNATFTVTTSKVTASTSVNVSASYGAASKTALLTLMPPPTSDVVAIQQAVYILYNRRVRVLATSTNASATLKVYVTSTGAAIGTLINNGNGTYAADLPYPANPQNVTVRSSLGGSASKAVSAK
ncbi:MAG: IPT/TIG domain-containing protein [Acidobacteriota bacterium]